MGFFSKIKKGFKKFIRPSLEGGADFVRAVGGYYGMPELGNRVGDMIEPGDTSAVNAQEEQDRNYARSLADQEKFSRDSLKWRVEDARRAGLSPLAALGYQAPQFIPYQPDYGGGYYAPDDYGISDMGQDIGRAIAAGQTERERRKAQNTVLTNSAYDDAILRRTNLENDSLILDIQYKQARLDALRTGQPAGPVTNAPPSLDYIQATGKYLPPMDFPDLTQGGQNVTGKDYQYVDSDWGPIRVPTQYAKQAMEDDIYQETGWAIRNMLVPLATGSFKREYKRALMYNKKFRSLPWRQAGRELNSVGKGYNRDYSYYPYTR